VHNEDDIKEGRRALLLTASGLECWDIEIDSERHVSLAWTFHLLADLEESKVFVGQKKVYLLDFQVDLAKEKLKLLFATYSMDKITGSSDMQYCLATYSYGINSAQREGGIDVILPKARVEDEEVLCSMQLRIGGKPEGSAMILSNDGTATVAYFIGGTVRLYQFELAWDVGKVVDACVLSSSEGNEEGSWLVLTEKAGVWAIPSKAIVLCGVEPPEKTLLLKHNHNEATGKEDPRHSEKLEKSGFVAGSEAQQIQALHDEEAEALVGQLFQEYLSSGKVDFVVEKLQQAGAFEREGSENVFSLASKALVDTLAKHWTSSMATNMAMMAAVSSQLAEKQHRHQQFLHFLLSSKSLEELKKRQSMFLLLHVFIVRYLHYNETSMIL
jgi:nuclear pore complex protein Nup133